jgi:tetratricopeptide (TPR) repeat protein
MPQQWHLPRRRVRLALVLAMCGLAGVHGRAQVSPEVAGQRRAALAHLLTTAPADVLELAAATVALARDHHDTTLETDSHLARAMALHRLGHLPDALAAAHDAREVAERSGHRDRRLRAHVVWARVAADRGDLASAVEALLPAVAEAERQAPGLLGPLLAAQGRVTALIGDHELAGRLLQRAETQLQAGDPPADDVADLHLSRGLAALAAGDLHQAVDHHTRALRILQSASGLAGAAHAHLALGDALAEIGHLEQAAEQYAAGLTRATRTDDRLAQARLHHGRARLAQQRGDTTRAAEDLQTALALATAADARADVSVITWTLFELLAARGETGAALEFLRLHGDAYRSVAGREAMRRLVAAERNDATARLQATHQTAAQALARVTLLQRGLIGLSAVALALATLLWYRERVRAGHASTVLAAGEPVVANAGPDDLLVMCATCKRVRGDEGWMLIETWLRRGGGRTVSHGICPECEQRVLSVATTDPDLLQILGGTQPTPERRLRGGFDWPPSDGELARVVRADDRGSPEPAGREGYW